MFSQFIEECSFGSARHAALEFFDSCVDKVLSLVPSVCTNCHQVPAGCLGYLQSTVNCVSQRGCDGQLELDKAQTIQLVQPDMVGFCFTVLPFLTFPLQMALQDSFPMNVFFWETPSFGVPGSVNTNPFPILFQVHPEQEKPEPTPLVELEELSGSELTVFITPPEDPPVLEGSESAPQYW